jgi:hypothetical protein
MNVYASLTNTDSTVLTLIYLGKKIIFAMGQNGKFFVLLWSILARFIK